MNVNTSQEDRERAPAWATTWGRIYSKRDKMQMEQKVYKCVRCTKIHAKNPDRSPWQYGVAVGGGAHEALRLACGHFVKQGEALPVNV